MLARCLTMWVYKLLPSTDVSFYGCLFILIVDYVYFIKENIEVSNGVNCFDWMGHLIEVTKRQIEDFYN